MVKRHNTKLKILIFLLSNKTEQFTIRSIAQKVKVDYKTVYLAIQDLIEEETVLGKKIGQTIVCSVNQKVFNPLTFEAEWERRDILIKKKSNLRTIVKDLKIIEDPFFVMLLFGSQASGKINKHSDIDIILITNDKEVKEKIINQFKLYPLDIHLLNFTTVEFISMIKTTEFNVGKEAFHNNIILHGIENYYRLIENG